MKTRTREVKTYIIEWVCDCGGLVQHNVGDAVLMVNPPKHLHKCDKCDYNEYSEEIYPKAKVEYVDEVEK